MGKDRVEICPKCGKDLPDLPKKSKQELEKVLSQEVKNEFKKGEIHCKKCGGVIDDDSIFCTHCGHKLSAKIEKKEAEGESKKIDDSEIPNIGRWSWGGASITFWYSIYMKFGCGWTILLLLLIGAVRGLESSADTVWLGFILYFVMFFVVGFNARKWAWRSRKWDSLEQFQKTQRAWDVWGIIIFVLTLLVGFFGAE